MEGDLLFFNSDGKSPFDKLIVLSNQWHHQEPHNIVHVAGDIGGGFLIEAIGTGVQRRPFIEGTEAYRIALPTKYNTPTLWTATMWLQDCIGLPYGWGDIVQAAFVLEPPFFTLDPKHYDCASLMKAYWEKIGVEFINPVDIHDTTPVILFGEAHNATKAES